MQSVSVAMHASTFEYLLAAGSILFFPYVRCGHCMGSGMDHGERCAACLDSVVPGWLQIKPAAPSRPIVEVHDNDGRAT